jgi:hypothetical protein
MVSNAIDMTLVDLLATLERLRVEHAQDQEYLKLDGALRASAFSGLWGPAAPLGPVAAPLVPRCALLPAPTPRLIGCELADLPDLSLQAPSGQVGSARLDRLSA